jgi:hypothetical protein
VRLGEDRWAFRAANGLFLSPRRAGEVTADAQAPGEREALTVERRSGGRVALRTVDGTYLTRGRRGGDLLLADARSAGEAETFLLTTAY